MLSPPLLIPGSCQAAPHVKKNSHRHGKIPALANGHSLIVLKQRRMVPAAGLLWGSATDRMARVDAKRPHRAAQFGVSSCWPFGCCCAVPFSILLDKNTTQLAVTGLCPEIWPLTHGTTERTSRQVKTGPTPQRAKTSWTCCGIEAVLRFSEKTERVRRSHESHPWAQKAPLNAPSPVAKRTPNQPTTSGTQKAQGTFPCGKVERTASAARPKVCMRFKDRTGRDYISTLGQAEHAFSSGYSNQTDDVLL